MTSNHPQSSKQTAELARWLWPFSVNLDWDGGVTVRLPKGAGWQTFSPLTELDHCIQASAVLQERSLVPAFVKELEIQLHKLRSVKPRFGPIRQRAHPVDDPELKSQRSSESPEWIRQYLLLLGSVEFLADEEATPETLETKPGDQKDADPSQSSEGTGILGWVQRFVRGLLKDEAEADDIVQETFEKARREGKGRAISRGWLAGVARNLVLQRMRKRVRRRRREEAVSGDLADNPGQAASLAQAVMEAIEDLPQDQQKALLFRYMSELKPKEIAEKLSLPVEEVYRLLERGASRVHKLMRDRYGADWKKAERSAPVGSKLKPKLKPKPMTRKTVDPLPILSRTSPSSGMPDSALPSRARKKQRDEDTSFFIRAAIQKVGGGPKVSRLISRWVQVLPQSQQRVFILRHFANMQFVEIGELLGLTLDQVGSNLKHGTAGIEQRMRNCAEHDVLLSQITAALLCVARDHTSRKEGEI